MNNDLADMVIVGGGPTGLFGACYAGMRGMSVTILDSLEVLGGQLATLYPEKYIYDVAGFPKVLAKDLVADLIEQGLQYRPTVRLGEQVERLEVSDSSDRPTYRVITSKGDYPARTVLISAGVGAFSPKKLPLKNATEYEGNGLYYFVQSMEPFRGKRVLIVGGGDSAVDWANMLSDVTDKQFLIHRRDGFRAHEESVSKMRTGPTQIKVFHELMAIEGDGTIERAVIYDNRSKVSDTLSVDAVLVNIGFESSLGPIKDWGLELEGSQIKVDSMMQTNRPGIFAAGDVTTYPGKLKLIVTGFSEAAIAANHAKHYLEPEANIFPGHSTARK
jgi:thioredoxin reductase (NADPH)